MGKQPLKANEFNRTDRKRLAIRGDLTGRKRQRQSEKGPRASKGENQHGNNRKGQKPPQGLKGKGKHQNQTETRGIPLKQNCSKKKKIA